MISSASGRGCCLLVCLVELVTRQAQFRYQTGVYKSLVGLRLVMECCRQLDLIVQEAIAAKSLTKYGETRGQRSLGTQHTVSVDRPTYSRYYALQVTGRGVMRPYPAPY